MINLRKQSKEHIMEERFINGFNSDGKTITYFLNGKVLASADYEESKELKLLMAMENQMKEAVENASSIQYRTYEEQLIAATGLSMCASMIFLGSGLGARPFFYPTAVLPFLTWVCEYSNYVKDTRTVESIEKYKLYLENQELLNSYAEKLFKEAGEPEGYLPAYVTPNDVDGYSLKELQELIDGIKEDNEQAKLTLD